MRNISVRGQTSILALPLVLFVTVMVWALGFGRFLSNVGQAAITDNQLSGVEAFFMGNLNFWFFLFLILATLLFAYNGGRQ